MSENPNLITDPDDEEVGRYLQNAFGEEEIVVLPVRYWKYFDWLASIGTDMDEWVKQCDLVRHSNTWGVHKLNFKLRTQIRTSLGNSEKERYLRGENVPLFIRPSGYEEIKSSAPKDVDVSRELMDSKGEKVSVRMPTRYWKYFDWLALKGVDMDKWVKEIDASRFQGARVYALYCLLMNSLREDEKRLFKTDEPSPLFITPDGYDL